MIGITHVSRIITQISRIITPDHVDSSPGGENIVGIAPRSASPFNDALFDAVMQIVHRGPRGNDVELLAGSDRCGSPMSHKHFCGSYIALCDPQILLWIVDDPQMLPGIGFVDIGSEF
jgi:hypothetical protein